jgi:hypothetical protein
MSGAKDKFSKAIAYEEWEKDPIWQRFLDCQEEWQRPNTQMVNDLMQVVPDGTRKEFLQRLRHANDAEYAVDFERHALGVAFAMQRLVHLMEDDKEKFAALSSAPLIIAPEDAEFTAFSREDGIPTRKKIHIRDNFTLFHNDMPFIYKAKYSPVRQFGAVDEGAKDPYYDYNLLLKYNEAIEQGYIGGAAIEIRGLIDPDFLAWACGTSVLERSDIPHVQLIYNMQLPSGAEFRFTIKKAQSHASEMFIENDVSGYSSADLAVVEGIQNALKSKDDVQLIEILSGQTVFAHKGHLKEMFKQCAAPINEAELKNPEYYENYISCMRKGIWRRALRIKPTTYNHDKDNVLSPENIGLEDDINELTKRIEIVQEALRDGEAKGIPRGISLGDDPESPEYRELLQEVVFEFANNIAMIRARLLQIQNEEQKDPSIVGQRLKNGYDGLEQGYSLDIYHIMLDSISIVKSRHFTGNSQKSLANPQRFMDIDHVLQMLDERAESEYKIIRIFDPQATDKKKRRIIKENVDEDSIRGDYITLARENNKRIAQYLDDAANGLVKLNPDEKRRLKAKRALILSAQRDIALNSRAKAEAARNISSLKKSGEKITSNHPEMLKMENLKAEAHDLQDNLFAAYEGILSPSKENSLICRAFVEEKNIIKVIYTIDYKGQMTFEEEKASKFNRRGQRASHSELAGGCNVFAAGEIIFSKAEGAKTWDILEINNGSGHYRPPPKTLRYAASCMKLSLQGAFARRGLKGQALKTAVHQMLAKSRLTDALARGISLQHEEQDLRQELTHSAQLMAGQRFGGKSNSPKKKTM